MDIIAHAVGALFSLTMLCLGFAFVGVIFGTLFMFAVVLFKGAASLLSDAGSSSVITLRHPIHTPKVKPFKELEDADGLSGDGDFFEDASGIDLEYRGVGVAEDRRAASNLRKVV